MVEHKDFNIHLSPDQLDDIGGCTNSISSCGVSEKQFPCMKKCCIKSAVISGNVYVENCQNFSSWKSLPQGVDLTVAHIFECSLYGYCKRIKE